MTLTLMLIAGVATGLFFDVIVLAALCFAIMLVGLACAACMGEWQSTLTLALGILVLQIGYAVGILVYELELHSRSSAGLTSDPRD